ncbi:MAG TPA: DEAD/DEAH box helicase [Candidatus Acidoferrales bacterium]|nr:DEAD/DEAH box helicase [Candidatus Acidoferrales bacterium]
MKVSLPHPHDWRTTDADEINKRRWRAQTEAPRIFQLDHRHPIFSNFRVGSSSGLSYDVEIRSLARRLFSCTCVDFRTNALGTCKHVEATLLYLEARYPRLFQKARRNDDSPLIDIVPDPAAQTLRIERVLDRVPGPLQALVCADGRLRGDNPERTLEQLRRARIQNLRISQEVEPWLEAQQQIAERRALLREYEQKVQAGEWPLQETLVPLYPYQREGMLHLAFKERALLADEMGLGKTIQAIAACALLHRLEKASRVLVVTPASLKTEWEEQIQRFTKLGYQLVFGPRRKRLALYVSAPFFTIVNYEQMLKDALDVNEKLKPDVVILDEAQRIKNWNTKTAQAVKRLRSRYAFVLTGTPIENRIDELYSLMDFLNPAVLGPLFRFNREFYELDERGRPAGYRNLEQLHRKIKPFMLRRRKADVETELPERSVRNFFVALSREQRDRYDEYETMVARLASIAKRRPLTPEESERLMRGLAMMRMVCDTNYILDPAEKTCPKLRELEKILEECRENSDVKVLVFSEWERMLGLVRELCERLGIGYALHTGSVPQRRRRAEILLFKNDPNCRVFLSTDSGSTGLNLQDASVVINCDLPWNPARLEQRIARAWRKNQTRSVTVINLVSEGTIEHRMLETLASKQALAEGVLDLRGDLKGIRFKSGRQALLARLQQMLGSSPSSADHEVHRPKPLPADRALAFSALAAEKMGQALLRCEERYPLEGSHSVLLVVVDADAALWREKLSALHKDVFTNGHSDPLSRIEVIDRATDEALRRMIEAGLVAPATRAVRGLYSRNGEAPGPAPLSEAEKQKALAYVDKSKRKLKMALLLESGGLIEEAREACLETVLWLGRALAVKNRLPEPADVNAALQAPLSHYWGEMLPAVGEFAAMPSLPAAHVTRTLEKIADSIAP